MKKKNRGGLLLCALATVAIFAFSAAMFFMYKKSLYPLFRLGAVMSLVFGAVNMILLLFGKEEGEEREASADGNTTASESKASDGDEEPQPEEDKPLSDKKLSSRLKALWRAVRKPLSRLWSKASLGAKRFVTNMRLYIEMLLLLTVLIVGAVMFISYLRQAATTPTLAYWQLILSVAMFVAFIVVDKLCKHTEAESPFCAMLLRNCRAFFAIIKLTLVGTVAAMSFKLLNIFDIHKYVVYALTALFFYSLVMILVSLGARAIKKELDTLPGVVIILPFVNADIKELAVLSFLEENTGITLRSLWSIKYMKRIIPYAIFGAAIVFWLSTGIVYVGSHQQGAVYRFGHLEEETLSPGLHMTLPYPIEKTQIYDTETVNKMTVGYRSTENTHNVWTEAHGDSEYKLLLGSGNELVSINLRIEYKISDLKSYVRGAADPAKLLEAKAYHLVTERTINSDLDTILAANRESFAKEFREALAAENAALGTGLEIVNVIMESIHLPVEVAKVYQDFIGAEIEAERIILNAEADAAVTIAEAETLYRQHLNDARIKHYDRIAAARTEIAEFIAAVDASNAYPEEYAYYKYLDALGTAYERGRLIIVGKGVDSSRLYYGDLPS